MKRGLGEGFLAAKEGSGSTRREGEFIVLLSLLTWAADVNGLRLSTTLFHNLYSLFFMDMHTLEGETLISKQVLAHIIWQLLQIK